MTYSINITEDDVCAALRAFLLQAFGCEVVRGFDNRVPMPVNVFINITTQTHKRLATNTVTLNPNSSLQTITQPIRLGVQLDFYSANAADMAAIFETLWRDTSTCDFLAAQGGYIQPLENNDPMQMAIVDGEQQYSQRWIVKAFLQYNGAVTLDQQFFEGATVTLVDVDTTYP